MTALPPLALDVAGRILEVNDLVAYCLAGTSAQMRVGKVIKISAKQVAIKQYGETRPLLRNHEAVAKVSRE